MYQNKRHKDISPNRDKVRYLKTLNDQVLSKTQIALLAINDYEMRQSRLAIPLTSFVLEPEVSHIDRKAVHLTIKQSEDIEISMLEKSLEYYKIDCKGKIFPLKFMFKHVKNEFRFMASFKHMFPGEGSSEIDFIINKSMKKSISPQITKNIGILWICLQAKNNIGIMTMQFSFYNQMLDTLKQDSQSIRIRKTQEFSPMRTYSYISRSNYRFREDSVTSINGRSSRLEKMLTEQAKPERSRTQTNFRIKNIFQATNYNELSTSRKHIMSERKEHRVKENKVRQEDFWQHRQKERELKEKANEKKKVISLKQIKVSEQMYSKRILTRDITTFLYLHKFLSFVHSKRQNFLNHFSSKVKIKMYQNKFYKTLKKAYSKICSIMPLKTSRNKCSIHSAFYLLTRISKPAAQHQATKCLIGLFQSITPSMRIIQAFDQSTVFRRKLRLVQKIWRTKFHMRLEMIKMSGQRHVNTLLDMHPKFSAHQYEWKKQQHLEKICLEYIRETATKFNELYLSYLKKQDELYDQRRLNEEIKKSNKSLSVKQQKPLLHIPPDPVKPHYRFFRDLDILRGMIRSWFEIEVKKAQKRARSRWE